MSKKIILRQSVKSGVAVVFFFGLGMASINAQTTQTTQPTGKVGINTTNPTETLDVKGKVRIQELYTDNQQTGTNNATFTATNVVTVDNNGVLGKKPLSSIIMPTIPTEPWRQLGGTNEATTNTQNIYQNGKVGIGNYASTSNFDSDFEVNSNRNGYHIGIANGADIKWNLSAENDGEKSFTLTRRHKDLSQGRLLSITKDAKLYLGNTLTTPGGGNTKITLDGKDGNIILIDKWRVGLKGNSLMFYNSSTTGDSNNKFTLTKEGKLFLGKDLNGDGNGTGANILLNGDNGRVAIGKNSASYNLDVNGDAKISGLKSGSEYTAAYMVVADANGVLGKQALPTIPTMPTIPTEPWRVAGGSTQATSNTDNIYQNGNVGIGNFGDRKTLTEKLEVEGNTSVKGKLILVNESSNDNKFLTYTEGTQLLFDKKIAVPILHTTQTGVMASLTNVGKLYLGNNLTKPDGETLYTKNAKILLDGENGTVGIGKNYTDYDLDVNGYTRISQLPTSNDYAKYYTTENGTRVQKTKTEKYAPKKMVVVDDNGVLGKADIPTGGGSGNGVTKHTGNSTPQCNAANAGTIHYKEEVTVNGKSTSVMGFCMKTATKQYRWFYIFGGAGTTTGSEAATPNFGDGL